MAGGPKEEQAKVDIRCQESVLIINAPQRPCLASEEGRTPFVATTQRRAVRVQRETGGEKKENDSDGVASVKEDDEEDEARQEESEERWKAKKGEA